MTCQPRHDEVLRAIRRIVRAVDLQSKSLERDHGLTVPQWILLDTLRGGPLSIGELAHRVQLSAGTTTNVVARLEAQGLLLRRRDEGDRRRVWVEATAAGADRLASAPAPQQLRFLARFHRLEATEQRELADALDRVGELLDAQTVDAAPFLAPGEIDGGGRMTNPSSQQLEAR